MQNCPHCGQPTISPVQKLLISPLLSGTCKACGKRVYITWLGPVIACVPVVAAAVASAWVEPVAARVAVIAAGVAVSALVYCLWVPLAKP